MPFSRAVDDAVLGVLRGTSFTGYSSLYAALLTTAPSANDGTGAVEIATATWTNYARVSLGTLSAAFNAITGTSTRSMTNANAISFGTATISGTPPVVVAVAFYDALTVGNFVAYATLTTNKTVSDGDPVQFAAAALSVGQS